MAYTDSLGVRWRQEILEDLDEIKLPGCVPGTLLVWGHSARPILNSAAHGRPVLIAAAELGCGRVVVLAHESLLKTPPELTQNIERWLTKGEQRARRVLNGNSKASDVQPGDVLVWKGAPSTGGVGNETVVNHLLRGGGLVHAICPWGWLQIHKGQRLSDMPLNGVLDVVGIGYTDQTGSFPEHGLDVRSHRSSEASHIVLALRRMLNDPEHLSDDDDHDDDCVPLLDISSIPDEVCSAAIYPELRRLTSVFGCDGNETEIEGKTAIIKKLSPCHDNPINGNKKRVLIDVLNKMARLKLVSLPAIEKFLGCVPSDARNICRSMKMCSTLKDIHPTGLYLAKNSTLVLRVQGSRPDGWSVQVGAHSDNLSRVKNQLRRWPQLVVKTVIEDVETSLYSPYGGLVYLESPDDPSEIEVCLENVTEAPLFNACDPDSVQCWQQQRTAPGSWADLIGRRLIITLPSSSIRHIEDPSEVMHIWDQVISGYHELRGTDPDKHRRQWIVTDEQPVAGYMHAGYPIVTSLDVAQPQNKHFLLDKQVLLNKGHWGVYHEIGHNMQRPAWTFGGTVEVTCNIFTLYAMDTISGQPVWIHEWLKPKLRKVAKYILEQSFANWKSEPGLALLIYAQLIHHFGWDVYKKVFREYEQSKHLDGATDQQKIDEWLKKMSMACGHNLAPLFDFWKIPIGQDAVSSLQHLQAFLPSDEVTNISVMYANSIRDKYHIPHS